MKLIIILVLITGCQTERRCIDGYSYTCSKDLTDCNKVDTSLDGSKKYLECVNLKARIEQVSRYEFSKLK